MLMLCTCLAYRLSASVQMLGLGLYHYTSYRILSSIQQSRSAAATLLSVTATRPLQADSQLGQFVHYCRRHCPAEWRQQWAVMTSVQSQLESTLTALTTFRLVFPTREIVTLKQHFLRTTASTAKRVLAIVILSIRLSRPGTDSSPGEIETPGFHSGSDFLLSGASDKCLCRGHFCILTAVMRKPQTNFLLQNLTSLIINIATSRFKS